jgi:hypothetical protein
VAFNSKVQIDSDEKGKLVTIIMKALRFIQMWAQKFLFSFFKRRTFTEYTVNKHIIFIPQINVNLLNANYRRLLHNTTVHTLQVK